MSGDIFKFESKAQLDESEGEEDEEVAVEKKGDSDFSSGVTVEAWTSFNRWARLSWFRVLLVQVPPYTMYI